jgi:hypothetical protein
MTAIALAGLAPLVGCVNIPDNVRAEFRAPDPQERSNFRPGAHGHAPGREAEGLVITPSTNDAGALGAAPAADAGVVAPSSDDAGPAHVATPDAGGAA